MATWALQFVCEEGQSCGTEPLPSGVCANRRYPDGASGEEPACRCRRCLRQGFDPWVRKMLEESVEIYSSVFAWRILWTEEPGELQSMGSQSQKRLKHLSTHA